VAGRHPQEPYRAEQAGVARRSLFRRPGDRERDLLLQPQADHQPRTLYRGCVPDRARTAGGEGAVRSGWSGVEMSSSLLAPGSQGDTKMADSFRDLVVWRKAMVLATEVYRITDTFPQTERYGLASQVQRAAVAVPSDIAEGKGRLSKKEVVQMLSRARGSLHETDTQIEISK